MREFFKGWRRKAGCVTLVLACVVFMEWFRSLSNADFLRFPGIHRQYQVIAASGSVYWIGRPSTNPEWRLSTYNDPNVIVEFIQIKQEVLGRTDFDCLRIACWWFVLPPAIFSAYLILWKPRTTPKGDPDA